ncbi:MAG: GGDEF domain-containing protein [Halofilum sp. (in: g-proteobacteria)]
MVVVPADDTAAARRTEFEQSLLETILEASPDGMLVVDEQARIAAHNQRLLELFAIDPETIMASSDPDLVGLDDRPLLAQALTRVKDPQQFLARVEELYADPSLEDRCEVELLDGRTLERHSKALRGPAGEYLGRVWFFRDITDRKQLERTLREYSHRDPLTGAANRRHFFERADEETQRARRSGQPLSVLTFDVDYFKRINDEWGHAVGDQVLISVCASVDPVLRSHDLFARIGGEEFAVLMPDAALDDAYAVAERIREKLEFDGAGEVAYTVSVGVATLLPSDDTAKRTLQRADVALYEAKRSGRNHTCKSEAPLP